MIRLEFGIGEGDQFIDEGDLQLFALRLLFSCQRVDVGDRPSEKRVKFIFYRVVSPKFRSMLPSRKFSGNLSPTISNIPLCFNQYSFFF